MAGSNTTTSAWLPDFIGWLKEAGQPGKRRLHAECSICLSMLDISTDVGDMVTQLVQAGSPVPVEDFYAQKQLEPTSVLACGHAIGSHCIRKWTAAGHTRCPVCRKNVACHKCKRIVPTPQCTPLQDPLGHHSFAPYEAILEKIPWTDGERPTTLVVNVKEAPKRYCGVCVSQQAMFLMNSTFLRNEKCLLCKPRSRFHKCGESEFQHRARRERAVEHLFRTRLRNVCDLLFARPGLRRPEGTAAAARRADSRAIFAAELTKLHANTGMLGLRRRLLVDCYHLRGQPRMTRRANAYLLGLLAWTVANLSREAHLDPIWFTGVEHLMAVDGMRPAISGRRNRGRWERRVSRDSRVLPPTFSMVLRRNRGRSNGE
ncbi:hypothetical protein PG985_008132 [Apiospora marii]|uniref:RING-type domain-containing protein n=1 Tax=Apiospora marii TaxID=335849 RepID=A0ABR1R9N0_9PEZI